MRIDALINDNNIIYIQLIYVILESIIIFCLKNFVFGELILIYPIITNYDIITYFTIFRLNTLNIFLLSYI